MIERQQVALVSGSTKGIGKAIAEQLVLDGYIVVQNSRSSVQDGGLVGQTHIRADVTNPNECKELIENKLNDTIKSKQYDYFNKIRLIPNNMNIDYTISKITKKSYSKLSDYNIDNFDKKTIIYNKNTVYFRLNTVMKLNVRQNKMTNVDYNNYDYGENDFGNCTSEIGDADIDVDVGEIDDNIDVVDTVGGDIDCDGSGENLFDVTDNQTVNTGTINYTLDNASNTSYGNYSVTLTEPHTYRVTHSTEVAKTNGLGNLNPVNDGIFTTVDIQKVGTGGASSGGGTPATWVNFNGITGEIKGGNNVSSVTRNGLGDYTLNFTTPLEDENYSAVCTTTEFYHDINSA